ncbi:MAG: DUF420 domain-containing protein [Planctomycetota bacterium]|jgi:putative membrane protein
MNNTPQSGPQSGLRNRTALLVIGAVSAALCGFIFWLVYVFKAKGGAPAWAASLPGLNACFNAASTALLITSLLAIRKGNVRAHVGFIAAALAASALFLAGYVINYTFQGDSKFPGTGWIRPVYFTVLISHILLSMAVVPLVLTTVYYAITRQLARHRRIARWTAPIWLYVSITGVAIYLMLRAAGAHG